MKNFKRLVASVMATAMLASCVGMTTFANVAAEDATYTITITHPAGDFAHNHEYGAYQIFTGKYDPTSKVLSDIAWGSSVKGLELAQMLVSLGKKQNVDGTTLSTEDQERYQYFAPFASNAKLKGIDFNEVLALQAKPEAALSNEEKTKLNKALSDSALGVAEVLEAKENEFVEKSLEMYKFAKIVRDFIKDVNAPISKAKTDGNATNTAQMTLNTPGYYMFFDTKTPYDTNGKPSTEFGPTAYILKVVGDVDVEAKVASPTLDKKIVEGNNETEVNTASIGGTVHYRLKSEVPNMVGYNKYFFNISDTLDKTLDFKEDTVKIYLQEDSTSEKIWLYDSEQNLTDKKIIDNVDCYVTYDSYYESGSDPDNTAKIAEGETPRDQNIKIVLKDFIKYQGTWNYETDSWDDSMVGYDIIVEYDAVLMENAKVGDKYDTNPELNEANVNKAQLIYSNNPNVIYEGDPDKPNEPGENEPKGKTPEEMVATFTTELDIKKVDNKSKPLAGAEFKVVGNGVNLVVAYKKEYVENNNGTYYKLKNGTFTEELPTADNSDKYESTAQKYVLEEKSYVEEHEGTGASKSITASVGEDGVLRLTGLGKGTYKVTETKAPSGYNRVKTEFIVNIDATNNNTANPLDYSVTWKKGTTPESSGIVKLDNSTGVFSMEIINNPGATLPGTGGIGTVIFYVAGSLLMAGAVVLFIVKKKSEAKEG